MWLQVVFSSIFAPMSLFTSIYFLILTQYRGGRGKYQNYVASYAFVNAMQTEGKQWHSFEWQV